MDQIESDRMLFFGSQELAEGFALIGFETWSNAAVEDLERELEVLQSSGANAFILVEDSLAAKAVSGLEWVKAESGRILVTEIPSLASPEQFRMDTDERVRQLLGGEAFDDDMLDSE